MRQYALMLFLWISTSLWATTILVNRPVVNMYKTSSDDAEVLSQAIYGDLVKVLNTTSDGWSQIQTLDGDAGWTHSQDLIQNEEYLASPFLFPVKTLFAHLYKVTDTEPHKPLMTLTFSTLVKLIQAPDASSRWLRIELIDGTLAWIQRGDLDLNPRLKSLEEMLVLGRKFLGLPYTWGGSSSYGYDCTGFVQMLYKQMGVLLPRHVCPQAPFDQLMPQSPLLHPVALMEMIPGDLIFFGTPILIHVGIYLGNGEFIHSGVCDQKPYVNIANLQDTEYPPVCARRLVK